MSLTSATLRALTTLTAVLTIGIASAQQQRIVQTDGSSTVFPVTEAMAEEFQKVSKGTKVVVGNSGTGGGFKKFCRGETDISNASRPIRPSEAADCKKSGIEYIELPIALDALAVMVNPKNTWVTDLTVAELKKIWEPEAQGKIMNWNQVRAGFPDRPPSTLRRRRRFRHLRLFHRSDCRQGTFLPRRLHRVRGRQCAGAGDRR